MKLTIEKLYERAEILLNEYSSEVEGLLQPLCHEGSVNIDVVEYRAGGQFHVFAFEEVYRGCRDLNYSHSLEVTLNSTLDAEGIHVFVAEETLIWGQALAQWITVE